jgi:hypothetical protein
MATDHPITMERLRTLLRYEAETGKFYWLVNRPGGCAKAGTQAGSIEVQGYVVITLLGRRCKAHRLAWFYVHGEWPTEHLDHINGDRTDNRICNLRMVSNAVNMQNLKRARSDNRLNLLGVTAQKNRFRARIQVDGKLKQIGSFLTAEEAHDAYLIAKRQLHEGCTI